MGDDYYYDEAQERQARPGEETIYISFDDLEFDRSDSKGKGNYGEVFRANYFGTDVAVKRMLWADDKEEQKYIDREVQVLNHIHHPNIIQFIGICRHEGQVYVVTEFVACGNLRDIIKSDQELPWKRRIQIALDVARALAYLHSRNIIHRDLKSENLLVEDRTTMKIKVCDFGFARKHDRHKRVMTLCGTAEWMAPEILLGLEYDSKVDVFSYGVVICELITRKNPSDKNLGRRPQSGFGLDFGVLRSLTPPECPAGLFQLAMDCCEYEADLRPDFNSIVKRLKKLQEEFEATQPASTPASTAPAGTSPGAGGPNASTQSMFQEESDRHRQMHVNKLIERATNDQYADPAFVYDLLLTYRYFTSPQQLFDSVIQRYECLGVPPSSVKVVRLRVLNFIRMWADKYILDFADLPSTLERLIEFVNDIVRKPGPGLSRAAIIVQKLLDMRKAQLRQHVEALNKSNINALNNAAGAGQPPAASSPLTPRSAAWSDEPAVNGPVAKPPPAPGQNAAPPLMVSKYTAAEVAQHLTLLYSNMYKSIQPQELLCEAWKGANAQQVAPCLLALLSFSERVTRYVATTLVRCHDNKEAAATMQRFVEIAEYSYQINNFTSPFDICNGIRMLPNSRLTRLVKALPKKASTSWKNVQALVSKDGDYKNVRKLASNAKPPCVPPLEMQLADLSAIEHDHPTYLSGGFVNFQKFRNMAAYIKAVQQSQSGEYLHSEPINSTLQTQLQELDGLPLQQLKDLCRAAE